MATIQERYDLAVEAYDRLMRGEAPRVVVDQNGERVEYTAPNAGRLAQYIADLAAQLGLPSGPRSLRLWA